MLTFAEGVGFGGGSAVCMTVNAISAASDTAVTLNSSIISGNTVGGSICLLLR